MDDVEILFTFQRHFLSLAGIKTFFKFY